MIHTGATYHRLVALLATPDPPDLPARRHRLTQPGDPTRRWTRLPGLLMAWAVTRQTLNDPAPPPSAWGGRPVKA